MLILESFQVGLSWECIPNKKEAFKKAYDSFNLDNVFTYDDRKANELLDNKDSILNRLKIKVSISNARVFKNIQLDARNFHKYLQGFTNGNIIYEIGKTTNELSDRLYNDLRKRGMRFVGSTIIYSYLQIIGLIYSHDVGYYLYKNQ